MNVLDLFSGIGGFSLGLERAGMKTAAFCEIDEYCRRVLARHWPGVPIYDDVRTLTAERLVRDGVAADVICGGFPCQDISVAGKGAGLAGERSGLWSEYARIIGEVRPRYVIVENVAALLGRGLSRVLGDLATLGYDAEWHCIPACAVGAPHRRDRLWIVANADEKRTYGRGTRGGRRLESANGCQLLADASRHMQPEQETRGNERQRARESSQSIAMADAIGAGLEGRPVFGDYLAEELAAVERGRADVPDADGARCAQPFGTGAPLHGRGPRQPAGQDGSGRNPWLIEPDVGRVAHGVPSRVDRLRGLGNAVVPQIPELIGRAIMAMSRMPAPSASAH
jgi:DNA (cytosine-5)-methyltransferase 1